RPRCRGAPARSGSGRWTWRWRAAARRRASGTSPPPAAGAGSSRPAAPRGRERSWRSPAGDGPGAGAPRPVVEPREPALPQLLAPAVLVQLHHEVGRGRVEVRRWIVEGEVTVLADAHERDVDGMARDQRAHAPAFGGGIGGVTLDEVEGTGVHTVKEPLAQVLAEARGMRVG